METARIGSPARAEPESDRSEAPLPQAPGFARVPPRLDVAVAAAVGNRSLAALIQRQPTTTAPPPTAATAGLWAPHTFTRPGPPPSLAVPESEALCKDLLVKAAKALVTQVKRANAMLGGPKGPVTDYRYFFAKVYSEVTKNEIDFVLRREYWYPSYVLRSVLYFEKIYEDNFKAWDAKKGGSSSAKPESHWQTAFEGAEYAQGQVAGYQTAAKAAGFVDPTGVVAGAAKAAAATASVLGSAYALTEAMKAHIRFDLPRAEAWVFNTFYAGLPGVRLEDFQQDFMSMSGVFDKAAAAMQKDLAEKLGLPLDLIPQLMQDQSMRHLFDADMATERADTWKRALELQKAGAGADPYTAGPGGTLSGDVTSGANLAPIGAIPTTSLRPTMESSAAGVADPSWFRRKSDNQVRADVASLGRAGVMKLAPIQRVLWIRTLLTGSTTDADELAALEILEASKAAGDLVYVVDGADAWDCAYSLDGAEYLTLRTLLRSSYYAGTAFGTAEKLLIKCIDGETANWEEDMIADILGARSDIKRLLETIGRRYPSGPDNYLSGLNKLEWQLDGTHEASVRAALKAQGLPETSGYTFKQ